MGLLQQYDDQIQDPYLGSEDRSLDDPGTTTPPTTPPPPAGNGFGLIPPTSVIQYIKDNAPKRGGGGGGGGDGGSGGLGPAFGFKPVPKFDAPAFVRPDAQSILGAPGFQARLQAGEGALQRSAASKGLLRSGGTFKDLIEYGQNFASNEYNNNFNQALQTHQANYQIAKDKYAPLLAEWDTLSKGEIQRGLAAYNRGTIWDNPHAGGGGGGSSYIEPYPNPNDYL